MFNLGEEQEYETGSYGDPPHNFWDNVINVDHEKGANKNVKATLADTSQEEEKVISDARHIEGRCHDD